MSEIFFGASFDGGTRCHSWHKLKSNFQYIGTPYWTALSELKFVVLEAPQGALYTIIQCNNCHTTYMTNLRPKTSLLSFQQSVQHWVFPEDNTRICQGVGPNHKPNKLFYIEWQFLHARRQCTTHKLNENYIWTVEWWLALILAPSGGVGVNYSGLGQSESSISSEEFWGLDQWECSINAKKWAGLLQQQWKSYCKWAKTIIHTKGRIHKSSIASKVCCQCHSLK